MNLTGDTVVILFIAFQNGVVGVTLSDQMVLQVGAEGIGRRPGQDNVRLEGCVVWISVDLQSPHGYVDETLCRPVIAVARDVIVGEPEPQRGRVGRRRTRVANPYRHRSIFARLHLRRRSQRIHHQIRPIDPERVREIGVVRFD